MPRGLLLLCADHVRPAAPTFAEALLPELRYRLEFGMFAMVFSCLALLVFAM